MLCRRRMDTITQRQFLISIPAFHKDQCCHPRYSLYPLMACSNSVVFIIMRMIVGRYLLLLATLTPFVLRLRTELNWKLPGTWSPLTQRRHRFAFSSKTTFSVSNASTMPPILLVSIRDGDSFITVESQASLSISKKKHNSYYGLFGSRICWFPHKDS